MLAYLFTDFTVSPRFQKVEKLHNTLVVFTALLSIPFMQANGAPRFGSINPRGSELKNISHITHPIMSPVLFHLSTR